MTTPAPSTPPPGSDDDGPSVDLGLIEVPIGAQLARWTMPLSELAALRQGQILDLGCPLHQGVTLVVGGQDVAEGELVDIEGSLGVRITRVLATADRVAAGGGGGQ